MIHFISGLPRSGSTLLPAILRQNPRFRAGKTSPVSYLFTGLQEAMSRPHAINVQIDEVHKYHLLRGLFDSYYRKDTHPIIFDKSRTWCAKLPTLSLLFPHAKVLCMVRNLAWIMDSVEVILRRNAFDVSGMIGYNASATVYSRADQMARSSGMIGGALDSLREAYWGDQAHMLLLIEYEALCLQPESTMRRIYNWLGQPWFPHDFDNVAYSEDEFDLALATPGLHTVRPKIEYRPRRTILPPDLFERFSHDDFWRNPTTNTRGVPVILGPDHAKEAASQDTPTPDRDRGTDRRADRGDQGAQGRADDPRAPGNGGAPAAV